MTGSIKAKTKLRLREMLDEAIVSSVWETIKKLVECESDHFQFMAAILS